MSLKFEVITPVKNFVFSSKNKVLFIEGRNYIKRTNNSGRIVLEDAFGNAITLHNSVLVYTHSNSIKLNWESEPLFKIHETMYVRHNKHLDLSKYNEGIEETNDSPHLKSFDIVKIPPMYFVPQN